MKPKTAKEAAEFINKNPKTTIDRVIKVIPEYKHALHKNQWIANFFRHLSPDLHQNFADLKPQKKVA